MKVAVTGAAGFLGKHLVDAWRAAGWEVLPIVRAVDARSPAGSRAMDEVLATPSLLEGAEALVHSAAIRHRYGARPDAYRASNVDLVARLLEAAAGRVRRFVHVSSVGVYGFPSDLPIRETHPFAPRTLYSATKVRAEKLAAELAPKHGVELTIVRPTIIYGPGDTNGMLDKMVRMIRAGTYRIVGDGSNVLHHTHIDDMVQGIGQAATHPGAAGEDFILAGPETTTLLELSELVAEAAGRKLPRVHVPLGFARAVAAGVAVLRYQGIAFVTKEPPVDDEKLDVMCVSQSFDSGKAMRLIGYAPRVRYREGVARTLSEVTPS